MADEVVLYFSPQSRAFVALWMLEETGVPYRIETVDIRKGEQKTPEFLKINPMGKVPALTVNGTVITESAAICLYLADRYGYGTLSPKIEDAARGPYLRWMCFVSAVAEPALLTHSLGVNVADGMAGWGAYDNVVRSLNEALGDKPYLLGDHFTALDVMMGGQIGWSMQMKQIPETPALLAYTERLRARPANQKAAQISFAPSTTPHS